MKYSETTVADETDVAPFVNTDTTAERVAGCATQSESKSRSYGGWQCFSMLRRIARSPNVFFLVSVYRRVTPLMVDFAIALRQGVGEIVSRPHGKRTL